MKQLFVALLVILLPMSVLAQHVKKNLKARPNSYFLLEESAPFKRTVVFAEPAKVNAPESGSSAVTSVALGSAGNILTIVASESNMLISDNKLNTVVFIHRNNDPVFGGNVSMYRYDISTDGGLTWDIDIGPLNPSAPQANIPLGMHRYPQIVLHNPGGQSDPDSAWIGYLGSTHANDGSGASVWDGISTGVARLDSTPSTWTETSTIINNGDVSIAAGLCNGAPGEFWAAEWYFAGEVSDIILLKGTWNNSTNDIDWVEETVLTVPYDFGLGSSVGTSLNMAFDKTGQLGYVAFLGDICDDATFQYSPVFFKTIDGGINWEGPIELDLGKFANVVAVVDTPTTAFEADLVVDYKGDPHLGVVIGGATAQDYTINTVNLAMFDFTYSSDDSAWIAIKLDTVGVLRSDVIVGANGIGHDNRPVGVVDSSGEKVFFFWADADNGSVPYRDLMGAGIDVKNRIVTNPVNFTKGDATWGGKAFFHTAAATSLYAGTTHTIPVVVTVAGSAFDQPAYFHYLSDITFDDSDFSVAWDTSQAVTTTISAAFTMILNANRLVQFLDNTAGATSWKWDFGDATFSPIANPSHTYLNSGTYTVCLTVGSCASFDNDSTCQDITVTGINDPDLNNHVNLFPNPSTGEFFIQLNLLNMDKVDLVVYNAHGLLISANEDIQIALGDMVKLDLTDQANGIYFVQISGEFGIITQKLSITR